MKSFTNCSHRRSGTPASGLTTRQWGLELPLQDTAVGMSTSAKPNQGKQGGGK